MAAPIIDNLNTLIGDVTVQLASILPNFLFVFIVFIAIYIFYKLATFIIKNTVSRTIKDPTAKRSILKLWGYGFFFITIVLAITAFSGSLENLGLTFGLLSAALGWALQRPITGIAAWFMLTVKKPIRIGDRIIIQHQRGDITGDVKDITLFYLILKEFGGTTETDSASGREIFLPTSIIFDLPITNFTLEDKYMIDEVGITVTYESNIERAKKILQDCAREATLHYIPHPSRAPKIRLRFQDSGIQVAVRFETLATDRSAIATDIAGLVFKKITKEKSVAFAYPHLEVIKHNTKKPKIF
jgi:small-conductance mechanosensitive channel